jgi:hypothetical protein
MRGKVETNSGWQRLPTGQGSGVEEGAEEQPGSIELVERNLGVQMNQNLSEFLELKCRSQKHTPCTTKKL